MATMYSALVFPQTSAGGSYSRPPLPSTFVGNGPVLSSPDWDPFSSSTANRTEWWEDTAGTLTYDDALLNCYGLSGLQTQQIATLKTSYIESTLACPVTVSGTSYTLKMDQENINLNLSSSLSAQQALASPAWSADTDVTQGQIVTVSGTPIYCSKGGTTGSAAPTPPTTPNTVVSDGTVEWALFARTVELTDGTFQAFTAPEIMNVAQQIEVYLHEQKSTFISLVSEVNAATTVSAIQAVVWPTGTTSSTSASS